MTQIETRTDFPNLARSLPAASSADLGAASLRAAAPKAEPVYTVRPGDTLSSIAARHNTTWQDLARINRLADPDMIRPGQRLELPGGANATYVVRRGDTLGGIAANNGTSVAALVRANGIANPDRIFPGQELSIPARGRAPVPAPPPAAAPAAGGNPAHRLGGLSERYESGGRGPGTVSTGTNDPGGVSYGTYQLSTNAGTLQSFLRNEGARWAGELRGRPGSATFSADWRTIASREPQAFGDAQHAFIRRTHYAPAVATVRDRTGLDLDTRHDAVRDAVWSVSVQHGGAATILVRAVERAGRTHAPSAPGYDRALIESIYAERSAYVLDVARNSTRLSAGERQQLRDIVATRYPAELRDALAMLDAGPPASRPAGTGANAGPVDGRALAREHGIAVKNDGVAIGMLDPAMRPVFAAIASAARELGLPQPVITSGNDSRHSGGSLHYDNRALDFRGNNIRDAQGAALAARVRQLLGRDFDVVFETFPGNPANDHLHVEYDPD